MRRDATTNATADSTTSTAMWARTEAVHTPEFAARTSATPWYSGESCTSHAQRAVGGDREERRGEQEQRHHRRVDDVHVGPATHERGAGEADAGEREPDQRTRRQRHQAPPRLGEPERGHHAEEADRIQLPADECPADLADCDVGRRHRGGQRGVVDARVLQPVQHVAGGVEDRAVHRRRGHQRGRDERVVGTGLPATDTCRPGRPGRPAWTAGRTAARRSR
jgi:hypothetical protein